MSCRPFLVALSLSLSAALPGLGCSRRAEPPPTPDVETVRMRLGAKEFSQPGSLRSVAQIGDEARPVVVAPALLLAAEAHGVPLADGTARVTVELAREARELPEAAFVLSSQTIPRAVAEVPAIAEGYARSRAFTATEGGFRLVREARSSAQATIEYRPQRDVDSTRLNLRLSALLPIVTAIDSEEFAVPGNAHLELGYGLAHQPGSSAAPRVAFRGVLSCAGQDDVTLVEQTLGTGELGAERWHDVRSALPPDGRCRLHLATRSLDEDEVRGAVWSIPRIVVATPAPNVARSVILVSLDTLRADHLSGYGYHRRTSPNIDARLIAGGTTFTDVSTTFPRTDVSHMSLFTSLYPGAQSSPGTLAAASPVVTLAEALRDAGFETVAFTEDALVAGSFGFWFGFDRFVERSFDEQHRGEKTFADARRYVADNRERRFFAFVHTYKTHDPYVASDDANAQLGDRVPGAAGSRVPERYRQDVDAYDRTIVEADQLIGGLLAELERVGLAESTVVVVLSDHGEAFGEHGVARHGLSFHQEQLHVPLVFRGPGIPAGERVTTPASLVDVMPTLLELLGIEQLAGAQGRSLAAAFAGAQLPADRPVFFSWMGADDAIGMRLGSLKLARAGGRLQLFDLAEDPGELRPRSPDDATGSALLQHLDGHVAASAQQRAATTAASAGGAAPIPQRVEDSLRALGYL